MNSFVYIKGECLSVYAGKSNSFSLKFGSQRQDVFVYRKHLLALYKEKLFYCLECVCLLYECVQVCYYQRSVI